MASLTQSTIFNWKFQADLLPSFSSYRGPRPLRRQLLFHSKEGLRYRMRIDVPMTIISNHIFLYIHGWIIRTTEPREAKWERSNWVEESSGPKWLFCFFWLFRFLLINRIIYIHEGAGGLGEGLLSHG